MVNIKTVQLDAARRRQDDVSLQNLIFEEDVENGVDPDDPDMEDLEKVDLDIPNVEFEDN